MFIPDDTLQWLFLHEYSQDSLNQRDGLIAELQSQLRKLEETVNNAAINASMISAPSLPAEHSYDAVSVKSNIMVTAGLMLGCDDDDDAFLYRT